MSHVDAVCGRKKIEVRPHNLTVGTQELEFLSFMAINYVGIWNQQSISTLTDLKRRQSYSTVHGHCEPRLGTRNCFTNNWRLVSAQTLFYILGLRFSLPPTTISRVNTGS